MRIDDFEELFNHMKIKSYEDILKNLDDSPYYYGYSITMGPDGKVDFKQFGNTEFSSLPEVKQPTRMFDYDEIVGTDEVKFVMEMAGLEKDDIKIDIVGDLLTINGERGERRYEQRIPLKYNVEKEPKATYKNGILEVTFKRAKPKKVDVA